MLSKPVKTRFWKKPRKTLADVLKREAKEFCLQTALHGYRFIVLPKKVLLERVTWSAVCVASLITAFVLLFIAWFNFQANPTVLITDSTHYAIWNYPFPAVTICDYNVISKKKALALAETLKAEGRTPQEMAWDLRLLFQLVKYTDPDVPQENYTWIRNIVEENGLSIGDLLDELSPSCEELLTNCRWKGEPKRCEHLFERVLTTEGFCCSFNYYALRNHTFNRMIASKVPTKPRRVSACGHQTALEVTALINPSDYFAAHLPSFGHRILVHNPYQFPDWSWQEILSEINTLLLVSVSPTLTYSSADIRSLPIRSRGCLFTDEMNLDNFNGYNFHNCMMKCRMNLTISLCGCRPYYSGNDNVHETCAFKDIRCLADNEHFIHSSVPGYNFTSAEKGHSYGSEKSVCNCLPDCEHTDYVLETSSGVLNTQYSSIYGKRENTLRNQSAFKIFFNDLVATRNRKDVLFSWHSLLAYYGGILGLFTGFSFVCGMEIVYFFVIKFLADATREKNVSKRPKKNRTQKINVKNSSNYENLDPKGLVKELKGVKFHSQLRHSVYPYLE